MSLADRLFHVQELKEQYDLIERRLAATQQEVADLNYDINTLTTVIAQARKFGTWNVSCRP
jgi:prefoldin subunit 5